MLTQNQIKIRKDHDLMEKQEKSPQDTLENSMMELSKTIRKLMETLEKSAAARSSVLDQVQSRLDGIEEQMAKIVSAQKTQEDLMTQVLQSVQAEQTRNQQMRGQLQEIYQMLVSTP